MITSVSGGVFVVDDKAVVSGDVLVIDDTAPMEDISSVIDDLSNHSSVQEIAEDYIQFLKVDEESRTAGESELYSINSLEDVNNNLKGISDESNKQLLDTAKEAELISDSTDIEAFRSDVDTITELYGEDAFDEADITYYEARGLENEWQYVLRDTRIQITEQEYNRMFEEYISTYANTNGIGYEDMNRIAYSAATELSTEELAIYIDFITTTPACYEYVSVYDTYTVEVSFNKSDANEWDYHQIVFQVSNVNDEWVISLDGKVREIPEVIEDEGKFRISIMDIQS